MGFLSIIGTIIVGFIVGLIARAIVPGVDALGFWLTTGLGIAGSVVGGVVAGLIWKSPDGKFHPAGWVLSVIGAAVLLASDAASFITGAVVVCDGGQSLAGLGISIMAAMQPRS